MAEGLFAGLKVIDCASFIAAPAAATIFSDFGADVIKIEPPGEGDLYPLRQAQGYFNFLNASPNLEIIALISSFLQVPTLSLYHAESRLAPNA